VASPSPPFLTRSVSSSTTRPLPLPPLTGAEGVVVAARRALVSADFFVPSKELVSTRLTFHCDEHRRSGSKRASRLSNAARTSAAKLASYQVKGWTAVGVSLRRASTSFELASLIALSATLSIAEPSLARRIFSRASFDGFALESPLIVATASVLCQRAVSWTSSGR
jgi:hypothetical protein